MSLNLKLKSNVAVSKFRTSIFTITPQNDFEPTPGLHTYNNNIDNVVNFVNVTDHQFAAFTVSMHF